MAEAAAVGTGVGVIGALTGGQDQSDLLDRQASLQRKNAQLALYQAKFDADKSSIFAGKHIGGITAGFGASGVTQDSGSVAAVLGSSAANAELDRQNILYGGQIKSTNYENQASFDEIGSQHALQGSYFSALSGVLSGGARMASYGYGGGGSNNNNSNADEDY